MFRLFFRLVLLVVILGVVAAWYYGYRWGGGNSGRGADTEASGPSFDAEARKAGAEIAGRVAKGANLAEKALQEAKLTGKIKSKMALDDTIDASRINVDTSGTVVTLSGFATTGAHRQRALQLARETDGVTKVVDKIEIKGR
ncbi:MAG TPA: BON domain-containing protein [Vicinamibacterales bacterium]|nr:BON domain-containing protein [Vicinamibacterales bacterium]